MTRTMLPPLLPPLLPSLLPSLLIAMTALLVGAAAGCASNKGTGPFMKTVNSIEPGTDMDRVREKLGAPDAKKDGVAPVRPLPPAGSPEAVLVTVPSGVRYREWIYHRGDSNYHVFAVPTEARPGHWEVLAVRSAPASKVY